MFILLVCVSCLIFLSGSAVGQWNPCTGRLEGSMAEIGCWGFKRCVKGQPVTTYCPNETVLERESLSCVKMGTGKTACGIPTNCTGLADGNYPDLSVGCISFYSCFKEIFMGRMFCDANLVYDKALNACNWVTAVPAPCGTKV